MTTEPATRVYPEKTYEIALAEMLSIIKTNLDQYLERNPDLDRKAKFHLVRVIGKLHPLTDHTYLESLRDSFTSQQR